jgi:hypothetical protein
MTFYDESDICLNEYDFAQNCITVGENIDWPVVQGAVYAWHCEESVCL